MAAGATKPSRADALVVDDDVFALALASQALQSLGFQRVFAFSSVPPAQKLIEGNPKLDLIVCDLHMPGVDGVEFLRWLAQRHSRVNIILASGLEKRLMHSVEQLAVRYKLNVLGSIGKPVTQRALAALLEREAVEGLEAEGGAGADFSPEEIAAAIDAKVCPAYQPKVAIGDGSVVGFEALLRWGGAGNPDFDAFGFVCAAEASGYMDRLTLRMADLVSDDMCAWDRQGIHRQVSLNMSAKNLNFVDFPERLHDIFNRNAIEPSRVTLELTESAVMDDVAVSLDVLARLRLRGFKLSLDDFGTGYATLEKLTHIPFTEVKLDRSFIHGARYSAETETVLRGTLSMSKELGLVVVAEGVETVADLALARAHDCDQAQGYLFAPAVSAAHAAELAHYDLASLQS